MTNSKKKIIITGFGKFNGVSDNPSSHLIREIESYINNLPNKNELNFEIVNSKIIEVSGVECKNYLNEIENTYLKDSDDNNKSDDGTQNKPFLLHLGVSSRDKENRLEKYGWNNADFRCNDENGWQPSNETIDSNDTNDRYETKLPIVDFVDHLSSKNYIIKESDDPGRFVCNYLYFLSLKLSRSYNTDSLFVHIPNFEEINKQTQLKFLVDLLNLISIATSIKTK